MVWLHRLGSLKVSAVLLALLFLLILGGTVAQAAWGASVVQTTLFSRVFFSVGGVWWPGLPFFLTLTGINLALGAWVHLERSIRHLGLWGLHASLVLFCFGSLGISLAQEELVLGLVPGASADRAFVKEAPDAETKPLPFTLTVTAFRIATYPGSNEAADYISLVKIGPPGREHSAEVRMNQPARESGWTIYQSSVQTIDGRPSPVFKLVHNPWGLFPYIVSILLLGSFGVHIAMGRRKGVARV